MTTTARNGTRTQVSAQRDSAGSVAASSLALQSLITNDPWDAYDLKSLLPLKEVYVENTQFGFLIRHYWMPATDLTFRKSMVRTAAVAEATRSELLIDRQMARCRSNECTWREKVFCPLSSRTGTAIWESTPFRETLCSYDCYDQTYVEEEPIRFALPSSEEEKLMARQEAIGHLPFLSPPGPIPVGFEWYSKVGESYMNFRLESEETIGETSVLVIRREGRFAAKLTLEGEVAYGNTKMEDLYPNAVIERNGITLFAWNRGVVLEDRFEDRVIKAEEDVTSWQNVTTQSIQRLVRSVPIEKISKTHSNQIKEG